jgi:hypothetical protein
MAYRSQVDKRLRLVHVPIEQNRRTDPFVAPIFGARFLFAGTSFFPPRQVASIFSDLTTVR